MLKISASPPCLLKLNLNVEPLHLESYLSNNETELELLKDISEGYSVRLIELSDLYFEEAKNAYAQSPNNPLYAKLAEVALAKLKAAANLGHSEAHYKLSHVLFNGSQYFTETDKPSSRYHLQIAAHCGHAAACSELGQHHLSGDLLTEKSVNSAVHYLSIAAQKDEVTALFTLGKYYVTQTTDKHIEGFELLNRSVRKNYGPAKLLLGALLLCGFKCKENPTRGRLLLGQLTKNNKPEAKQARYLLDEYKTGNTEALLCFAKLSNQELEERLAPELEVGESLDKKVEPRIHTEMNAFRAGPSCSKAFDLTAESEGNLDLDTGPHEYSEQGQKLSQQIQAIAAQFHEICSLDKLNQKVESVYEECRLKADSTSMSQEEKTRHLAEIKSSIENEVNEFTKTANEFQKLFKQQIIKLNQIQDYYKTEKKNKQKKIKIFLNNYPTSVLELLLNDISEKYSETTKSIDSLVLSFINKLQ